MPPPLHLFDIRCTYYRTGFAMVSRKAQ